MTRVDCIERGRAEWPREWLHMCAWPQSTIVSTSSARQKTKYQKHFTVVAYENECVVHTFQKINDLLYEMIFWSKIKVHYVISNQFPLINHYLGYWKPFRLLEVQINLTEQCILSKMHPLQWFLSKGTYWWVSMRQSYSHASIGVHCWSVNRSAVFATIKSCFSRLFFFAQLFTHTKHIFCQTCILCSGSYQTEPIGEWACGSHIAMPRSEFIASQSINLQCLPR